MRASSAIAQDRGYGEEREVISGDHGEGALASPNSSGTSSTAKAEVNLFKTNRERTGLDAVSIKVSKELARGGFKFVGPTIVYAFMQATAWSMITSSPASVTRPAAASSARRGSRRNDCARIDRIHPRLGSACCPAAGFDLLDPSPLDIEIVDIAHGWRGSRAGTARPAARTSSRCAAHAFGPKP